MANLALGAWKGCFSNNLILFGLTWGHQLWSLWIIQELNIWKLLYNDPKLLNEHYLKWIFWNETIVITPNKFLRIAKQSKTDMGLNTKQKEDGEKWTSCVHSKLIPDKPFK